MMPPPRLHPALRCAALALALGLGAAAVPAQNRPPADREQLERKLASTATLIERSSGAKQIESSGVAGAAAQRSRARELHRQAGDAFQAGQLEAAAKLLDEASRAMFDGVRLAAPEQITGAKHRSDFDSRMESTRVLLDAQKRIAAEKGGGPRAAELSQRIDDLLGEAAGLARGGRLDEARRPLDQAYLAVKAAIGGLRGGDTVVRSLNFADKAAEYAYEIDRNDTHRMLIQVLLKDRRGSAAVDTMVEQSVQAAAVLRVRAEAEAAQRDHDTAVKTLEESTRELVKAIRGAGVYIPG
jgi:hypothetical protein